MSEKLFYLELKCLLQLSFIGPFIWLFLRHVNASAQAKITYSNGAILLDEKVVRLEVPVHDISHVNEFCAAQHIVNNGNHSTFGFWVNLVSYDYLPQVAWNVLHDEEDTIEID